MIFSGSDPAVSITPSAADVAVARESASRLLGTLDKANGTVLLHVEEPNGAGQTITVPSAAIRLLVAILSEMGRGNAVRVVSDHAELTVEAAADVLNVSPAYAVGLFDAGKIPSCGDGPHRRALLKDVMAYRDEMYRRRSDVLDRMAALDQELGLT